MKTFKQHLNALEKQRKLEKLSSPKDNVMSVYVHGKHASNKIEEEADTGSEESTDLKEWFNNYNENVNDGRGIDSLHKELTYHYHKDLSNHPDMDHVHQYTRGSTELNLALIRSHKSGTSDIEPYDDGVGYMSALEAERLNKRRNGIDRAITSTPAPKDFDTFSGIGFDPRHLMDENNVIHSPAYISSSINPKIAHSFAHEIDPKTNKSPRYPDDESEKHILRIPVKQYQTNGSYVDSISNFGTKEGHIGEQEVLIKRGQNLKINPTPKTLTSWGQKTNIWTATPIED